MLCLNFHKSILVLLNQSVRLCDCYIAPKRMLIMAAIVPPPVALFLVTATAPIQTISAQEQKVTAWNNPSPIPFIIASFLLRLNWFSMHWTNDLMAQLSPTKEKTVLICDKVCKQMYTWIMNIMKQELLCTPTFLSCLKVWLLTDLTIPVLQLILPRRQ